MPISLFSTPNFTYPYEDLKFPGQYSEEKILFATREAKIMIYLKLTFLGITYLILFIFGLGIFATLENYLPQITKLMPIFLFTILSFLILSCWWVYSLWQKSVFIITTRRLTKFIHTTPFNRYQLSLGLDKIVDTGAYQKGFIQSIAKLGYFVARSSAGNIKSFKIVNITNAEDLHNYVNKLLFVFNKSQTELDQFRPFIPHLKGLARDAFVAQITPRYAKTKLLKSKN